MSFFGRTFIFDGIPSETYGLYISTPDGGDGTSTAGSSVEPILEKIYKRPTPYLYGVEQTPTLSFPIEFYSEKPIDGDKSFAIERWLFGRMGYKKLIIVQNDIQPVYYNCYLNNAEKLIRGNQIYGYTCTVECDAPWGWTNEIVKTYTYTTDSVNQNVSINIPTDNNFYTFPKIVFTTNNSSGGDGSGPDFSIRNGSDSNRLFSFTNLRTFETITVDNNLGIITSSAQLLRVANFNKNLFRFVRGVNNINISGNISSVEFRYKLARKYGG